MRRSRDKLPGHALSLSLKNIWEVIKDQRDLNLPAHKVSLGFQLEIGRYGCGLTQLIQCLKCIRCACRSWWPR